MNTIQDSATRNDERRALIAKIEKARGSKVITFFLSDRNGARAQIADDAVRPMYDHLRALTRPKKVDLFIYSTGGTLDVPWRIVSMIREVADEFSILVPYKAMSAATLLALGADEIVMGEKGELGPIDPQVTISRGDGGTAAQQVMSVEDVMSYIEFLKDRVGLTDQRALSPLTNSLAEKLGPGTLGAFNRIHTHIRDVARKMLTSSKRKISLDAQTMQVVIETLAAKTYQHGHAIGRAEAKQMGLKILKPNQSLQAMMWDLFLAYEVLCDLRTPIDPRSFIPNNHEERREWATMGCIESMARADHFTAQLCAQRDRKAVPQLNLNLNLNLQLPAGIDPAQVPAEAQKTLGQMLGQLQSVAQQLVRQEVEKYMPVAGARLWTQDGAWREVRYWTTRPPRQRDRQETPPAHAPSLPAQ